MMLYPPLADLVEKVGNNIHRLFSYFAKLRMC